MSRSVYYKKSGDMLQAATTENFDVEEKKEIPKSLKMATPYIKKEKSQPYIEKEKPKSSYVKEIRSIKEEPKPPTESKLDMKWETVQYVNSADPEVWGPAFWFSLHNGAARYPVKASPICSERMKGFILGMPVMIPCSVCQDHATAHIEANWSRFDEIVSGRTKLFNFFVDFHNKVNKRYGKPIMSYEDAWKLYTGRTNVTKLKYEDSCSK